MMSNKKHRTSGTLQSPTTIRQGIPEDERVITTHVTRSNVRQSSDPGNPRDTSRSPAKFSDHLNRFRLVARKGPKRVRRSERVSSDRLDSTTGTPQRRPILPKGPQILSQITLARSLADHRLHSRPLPIDISTPGTLSLLEYYHTSFWDNSIANNPEGKWMTVATCHPALLHATLCVVALHKVQIHGRVHAPLYLWHRGEAIRLISQKLARHEHATSDATLAAVATLSSADNSVSYIQIQ